MDESVGSVFENYLIALLAVAAAGIATALLWPLSEAAPFAFFYAAVAAAARRGGVGPRLTATLGSAVAGAYFFLPPHRSFHLNLHSSGALAVFLGVSTLIGWLVVGPRGRQDGLQTPQLLFGKAGDQPEKPPGAVSDATERKQAEDALKAGEERYRALFNSIDEGFCVLKALVDDHGRPVDYQFLEVNLAFEYLTGLGGVVGRTIRELCAEPRGDCWEDWFESSGRVVLTGEPARFANLPPILGGRWFDAYAFRVGGGDGEPRKLAVLFTNITPAVLAERERARLILSLENQRFELERLIEKAPAFMTILRGPDHVVELTNEKGHELVGRRRILGQPLAAVVPEAVAQGYVERLDHVYRTGEEYVANETRFVIDRTGAGAPEARYLNLVYQAMRDPDGSITGVFVHGVDVTEQVEAIGALKESEARFRQMADAMPQAVWTTDSCGVTGLCNQKFLEYFGFPEIEDIDERWRDAVHPDDLKRLSDAWAASLRDGAPYEQETRFRRASNGEYRWHLIRALPVRDGNGEIVRWIGTNTDIDEFKRLTENIKEADQRKDEFLATLAHELRNPLAPIRTGLEILKMKPKDGVFSSTVEMMERQLGHMIRLIDDLLDVARVSSGKIILRKERVTLRSVVETALEASRQTIEAKRQKLTVRIADPPIWLEADPTRIAQVVSNLLTNAAKYTSDGGRIDVSTCREDGEAVVRVKDTGDGIEAEMLTRIFEMFSQVGSSIGHSQGGLGIGLTVVKRLVELHGGRIEARSEGLERGSEFIVRLPIVAHGAEHEEQTAPAIGEESARTLRVLVVDDNRDSADTLAKVIALDGHEVKTAYGGGEALSVAESFRPDIALLDIGLPDLNGYEVAQRFRQNPELRKTKLVAVTGWGQAEDRRRSSAAGFDLHLVKPIDLNLLKNLLESGADAAKAP